VLSRVQNTKSSLPSSGIESSNRILKREGFDSPEQVAEVNCDVSQLIVKSSRPFTARDFVRRKLFAYFVTRRALHKVLWCDKFSSHQSEPNDQ
jgi:hypothetical protein